MVGRAERLARELRHPRVPQDAQLGGDVLGTAREHIRRVIHHDVDGQPVYGLHDPLLVAKNDISIGPGQRPRHPTGTIPRRM